MLLLLARPALGTPPDSSPSFASVGFRDGSLSRADIEAWLELRPPVAKLPPEEGRRRRIEERVLLEVLNRRFVAAGLDNDRDAQGWQSLLEDRLGAAALRRQTLAEQIVPDAEVEAAFRANPRVFDREQRFQLQNLFLRFPQPATEATREGLRREMAALRERLFAGADFAELARERSDSATRTRGGHLGTASLRDLQPAIAAAVAELHEGELSPVVETAEGLTLLRCLKVIAEEKLGPAAVKEKLRLELRGRRFEEAWQELEQKLLAAAGVELDASKLAETMPDAALATFKAGAEEGQIRRRDLELYLRDLQTAPASLTADELRRRVEELVKQRLLSREARRRGLFEEKNLREELTFETLELRAELVLQPEVRLRLVEPTAAELAAFYEKQKERLFESARFSFRSLTLPIRSDLPAAFYRQVASLGAELTRGDIEWAAVERQLHPEAVAGDHRELSENQLFQLGRNVEAAIQGLEPGKASGPHQEGRTLWLVQLSSKVARRPLSFEEARPRLRAAWLTQSRERIRAALRAEIVAAQEIRYLP